MTKNKNIEQLFKDQFESFEVQPSKKVWKGVRSDLFVKNIFHFSPYSMNIWYTAGILIIAAVGVISLMKLDSSGEPIQIKNTVQQTTDSLNIPASESTSTKIIPGKVSPRIEKVSNNNSIKTVSKSAKLKTQGIKCETIATVSESTVTESGIQIAETQNTVTPPSTPQFIAQGGSVLAWFTCSLNDGCVPLPVSFKNYSQNAYRYAWSFGDGGSSELASPSYIFDEPGTWFVSLTVYSSNNEISIFTDSIQVNPAPEARFSMDIQDRTADAQPVYFYNYSRGAESYLWDFGDGSTSITKDPDHFFTRKATTNIKLLAVSSSGCADSVVLQDAFKEGEPIFIFPTAFSPNMSGPGTGQYSRKNPENDIFYPYIEDEPSEYQLKIFNRTGILIFESKDIHIGWDGYYKEELLQQGVYVWKARASFADGRSVVRIGDVTLLWAE